MLRVHMRNYHNYKYREKKDSANIKAVYLSQTSAK